MPKNAQRKYVHQRIAVVAGFENRFPAHSRHPKAIAVMRNAADYAFEDPLVAVAPLRIVERPEAERIHDCDWPCAHGEDVAQNSADAGSRSLKRLDKTRVIMGFDLERDGITVPDIDNPRVLAGADQHAVALGRQLFQMDARALVRAVLAPHHRKNSGFSFVRFTLQDRPNLVEFGRRQIAHAAATDNE